MKFQSAVTEQAALDRLEWGITGKKPADAAKTTPALPVATSPLTEAAQELLKLVLEHPVGEERGLFEISDKIIPLHTCFIPNLTCGGSAPSMKTRVFQNAVRELVKEGWLLPPEPVPSHGGVAYELNHDKAQQT